MADPDRPVIPYASPADGPHLSWVAAASLPLVLLCQPPITGALAGMGRPGMFAGAIVGTFIAIAGALHVGLSRGCRTGTRLAVLSLGCSAIGWVIILKGIESGIL